MINDYGYVPSEHGYEGTDKGNVPLREALTFGAKKTDRQMGRGGLAKHATARMHKVFAGFDIRLEAPFYDAVLAKTLCNMPHETSYDTIKQHLTQLLLADPSMDRHIKGTSKEKFQDGSGLSRILAPFDQARLSAMFETLYGVHKQY